MVLDVTVAPYVLMTTWDTASPLMRYTSDVCRFVPLIFSSYFSGKNSVEDHFGHRLFIDWDDHQWHLFDNFMLHCVREYLYYYREMRN
ncbi:MAG: hypothetical protein UH625_04485, partial [Muribaculaceae bacterium]|nr:hypothetical protein [Muribaculaceae bacterium]